MSNVIQFPRQRPGRKWSPEEILAIEEVALNGRTQQWQEHSRIATTKKIASEAGKRETKKAKRKAAIADILDGGQQWTITVLMRLVGDRIGQPVSRTTITALLKELQAEGRTANCDQFWWKSINN
jgi:hypothetical protein